MVGSDRDSCRAASNYINVNIKTENSCSITASAVGDFPFMRLAEMYLIAAEAYARSGNDTEAKKYLTAFAIKRDPSYTESTKTGAALAEEIMNHRRIELWGEGFRWFDLKRLNLPCNRNGNNYSAAFCDFFYVRWMNRVGIMKFLKLKLILIN
jgi:hypothetical protein